MFFLCRLIKRKSFFYANYLNWSLTSPVILDWLACQHVTMQVIWYACHCWVKQTCNLTEIVLCKCSDQCFQLDFGGECLQRRKKELVHFRPQLQDRRSPQNRFTRSGLLNWQRATRAHTIINDNGWKMKKLKNPLKLLRNQLLLVQAAPKFK